MTFVGQYGGTTAAIRSAGRPCPMRPPRFRPHPLPAVEAAPDTRGRRAFCLGQSGCGQAAKNAAARRAPSKARPAAGGAGARAYQRTANAPPPHSLGASRTQPRRTGTTHTAPPHGNRRLGGPGASAAASPRLHPLLGRRAPAEQRGPSSSSECAPAPQSALLVRPLDGVPAHRRIAGPRLPRRRPEPRFVGICD